jgi:hypothetical protein
MHTATNEADELLRAELAVEESKAELNRSLRRVSQSSERLLNRVSAELKPGLVIAGVVVGVVALTGVTVALVRRRTRRYDWLAPERPSALGTVAKAVGLWALRQAARSGAQALLAHLKEGEPSVAEPSPAPTSPAGTPPAIAAQ